MRVSIKIMLMSTIAIGVIINVCAAAQKAELGELQKILHNIGSTLHFDSGSSDLNVKARADLMRIGDELVQAPEVVIYIESFWDIAGKTRSVPSLATRRMDAITAVLLERGVKRSQLQTVEQKGKAPQGQENDPAKDDNRRVERTVTVPPAA